MREGSQKLKEESPTLEANMSQQNFRSLQSSEEKHVKLSNFIYGFINDMS